MRIRVSQRWLVAVVLLLSAAAPTRVLKAQQPSKAPDAGSGVETIQIRPNVFVIFGGGANVTVHVGSEGAVLVDSGSAMTADKVRAAVQAITKQKIRLIINPSADGDHVGGNEVLAAGGASLNPNEFNNGDAQAAVLAHKNVLRRMSAPTGQSALFPIGTWPTETYTARVKSMYVNDEGIQVIRQLGAHSDGDSIVFFRRADVIATGDVVDLRHFPVIDVARGGSIDGEIDALNRLLELAIPAMPLVYKDGRTLIVPGHGRISDHAELVEYRDMVTVIRDVVKNMMGKGMSLEQIKAANPTQGYRTRYGSDAGPWTTDMFVEAVYKGLMKKTS
jgi:glyoxylase-like metal-dependent hydrolase (beta-lactamase superfamily II)